MASLSYRIWKFEQMAIIKGDRLSQNIAAASILAKVVRDRQMVVAAKDFSCIRI